MLELMSEAHFIASLIINRTLDAMPFILVLYVVTWLYSWT